MRDSSSESFSHSLKSESGEVCSESSVLRISSPLNQYLFVEASCVGDFLLRDDESCGKLHKNNAAILESLKQRQMFMF